ncbi:MAG: glycosyltransferase family 39 protein [Chloroflexota bacterium]|nr:glycosyltransferase family 39 protein [Chloroflexota bacterium]
MSAARGAPAATLAADEVETAARVDEWATPSLTAVALGFVLLLALGLRLYRLDGQSLWYDEGVSAFMTTRDWAEIARAAAADIHPPLYYWLLAAWAGPFGRGELALRGFSVVCGVLAVWVTWRLGRRLYDVAVGLVAAAVLALSPLAVQYGQEVRMYALASLLVAGATWAYVALHRELLTGARRDRRRAVLGVTYGLLAAALLYTHYYGVLVLAAHQAHFGLSVLATRRWSALTGWLLATGLAAILYLPWLPHALRQTGYYPGLGTPRPVWTLALDMVNVLSIGLATSRFAFRPGLAPFLVLAGAGLMARPREASQINGGQLRELVRGRLAPRPGARLLLVLWLLIPILGIVILSRTRPLYEPRFLMLVAPAWAILIGAGAVWLGRLANRALAGRGIPTTSRGVLTGAVAAAMLIPLLVPTTRSLAAYYFDPAYARDDYRGLARRVALAEEPGDAIILTAPGQAEIFGYYFRGQSDVFPLPAQRPIDVADTLARLDALAARHRRVWLVRWAANEADPDDVILRWLEARGRRTESQLFGRVELRLYELTASA